MCFPLLLSDSGKDCTTKEKESRGPTYMGKIWGRPTNLPRIKVVYNSRGQAIDGEKSTLVEFLGSLARNGKYCPIDVKSWDKMTSDQK